MSKRKRSESRMQNLFWTTGSICFSAVTIYMGVLLWKSYVWYNWLHQLQDSLNRSTGGGGPLI